MPKKKSFEDEVIEAAAMRLRLEDTKQYAVAKLLGISQSKISRMETDPESKYFTRVWNCPPPEGYSKEEFLAAIDTLTDRHEIRTNLRMIADDQSIKVGIVLQKDPPISESGGFSPNVATMLSRLLGRVSAVGCTWGPEILPEVTADYPKFGCRSASEKQDPIRFIPLAGISSGETHDLPISSTVVAMSFDRLVNKGFSVAQRKQINLNCIPLRFPNFKVSANIAGYPAFYPCSISYSTA